MQWPEPDAEALAGTEFIWISDIANLTAPAIYPYCGYRMMLIDFVALAKIDFIGASITERR